MDIKKPKIFLSYAREDKKEVVTLYQNLKNAGFDPWMDEHIFPGQRWKNVLDKKLRESDFIIFCLSQNSINKRGYFQKEIKLALENNQRMLDTDIYLIPALLDEVELPESLAGYQAVNPFDNHGWQLLIKAIQKGLADRGYRMDIPAETGSDDVDSDQSILNYLLVHLTCTQKFRILQSAKLGGQVNENPKQFIKSYSCKNYRSVVLSQIN